MKSVTILKIFLIIFAATFFPAFALRNLFVYAGVGSDIIDIAKDKFGISDDQSNTDDNARGGTTAHLNFQRETLKSTSKNSPVNKSCFSCSLSKESQVFAAHGGSGSFSVKSGSAGMGIAIPSDDWIIANVIVQYSVKPNIGSNDRSGTITVGDKIFTVDQTGTASKAAPVGTSTIKGPAKVRYQ